MTIRPPSRNCSTSDDGTEGAAPEVALSGVPEAEQFDYIVSNLPAKTGGEMLTVLMYDAWRHLKPGGRFCVVTVTGLRRFIERHMKQRFGNYDKLKQNPRYTVALAVRQ